MHCFHVFFFLSILSFAQVKTQEDLPPSSNTEEQHSPKKAGIYSALLPGAGQAYNKKSWKIPIVYTILGSTGYFVYRNHREFRRFRNAYFLRVKEEEDPYIGVYSLSNLEQLTEAYRRDRDLAALGFVAGYAIQILDAVVDAHLFEFDVSDDISMRWQPEYITSPHRQNAIGVSIALQW